MQVPELILPAPLLPYRIWCNDFTLKLPKDRVYLTFDDGPDPLVTPFVLDLLSAENIKATFFCIGKKAEKHPELLQRIISEGHALGNHTYSHRSIWKQNENEFLKDLALCEKIFKSRLFRPPYGHFKRSFAKTIGDRYKICLWNLLTYDFSDKVTTERALSLINSHIQPGSVLVFHDRQPLKTKMEEILPKVLRIIRDKNWVTSTID